MRVEYHVLTDPAGFTTAVHVRDLRGFEQRTVTLNRDAKGAGRSTASRRDRSRAARRRPRLQPVDNTLPIRRLRLGIGREDHPGRLDPLPRLTVEKAAQTYTRLDELTYRYASGTFEAELTVDDDGLVAHTRRGGGPGSRSDRRHRAARRRPLNGSNWR